MQLIRSASLLLLIVPLVSGAVGCIYDADDRCGEGQTFVPGENGFEACTCPSYAAINELGNGCVECGENERGAGDQCICVAGFAKSATGACEALPDQLGRECDPETEPCTDATYDYCAVNASGTLGYCTRSGCSEDLECDAGYACELDATPAYCSAPPKGQGEACGTSADCSGYEASYCEAFASKRCLVESCLSPAITCHGSWLCCDYTDLLGVSICIPPDALVSGECPSGGNLVEE